MCRLPVFGSCLAVVVASFSAPAHADCGSSRPAWVAEVPRGYKFDYFVGQGEDRDSPISAKAAAVGNAIASIVAKGLITVETLQISRQTEHTTSTQSELIADITEEVKVKGHSETVQGLEQVETHLEDCGGTQRSFVLVRIPKKTPEEAPSGLEPVWRSVIAPSWGQFYKDHTGRGVFILVGEMVLVPTAAIAWVMSSNAASDASAATKADTKEFYLNRRDVSFNVFLGAAVAAAGLYVYNVIDAIAAPQENVYAEAKEPSSLKLTLAPLPGGGHAGFALGF